MRPSLTFALTLSLGLAVAACDRQSPPAPQADAPAPARPAPAGGSAALAGTLDESAAGDAMPPATITAPDGTPTTLASLRGRPLLVNLWATWCAPCVAEMPTLGRLAEREGDRLQVVLVSQDMGDADLAPFLARAGAAGLPSYRDPQNALGFSYNSGLLPTTILYDADGREVWRMVGGYEWDGAAAAELVARAY